MGLANTSSMTATWAPSPEGLTERKWLGLQEVRKIFPCKTKEKTGSREVQKRQLVL